MKILGFTYCQGKHQLVMKCDSSLLNNRKPFFQPDWSEDMRAAHCIAIRICRLGKHIAPRFASRYYDALALGLDFRAEDWMNRNIARATAFDYSLSVGNWIEPDNFPKQWMPSELPIDQAIAEASNVVTLRTGDIVFVDIQEAQCVHRDETIQVTAGEQEYIYCKIK